MSNYKLEVENTEKLNSDINSVFEKINNELKRDDNLVANDLFDVDKKIEELKKSRRKWASGTGGVIIERYYVKLNISNVSFKPSLVFCVMVNDTGIGQDKLVWTPVMLSENYSIRPKFNDSRVWDLKEMYLSRVKEWDMSNITVIYEPHQVDSVTRNLTWYAFE